MKIYMIAGEASGDLLGGQIIEAIKKMRPHVSFMGIGGDNMKQQGLSSLFPIQELSVMGLFEIVPHIPRLLKRIKEVVTDIKEKKPDVIITIDAPGFTYRVAKQVKCLNIPLVHVTAPTVWAWRPGRAKKIARLFNHLFCLFPFEPPYFEAEGLSTTFMGHPLSSLLKNYETDYAPQGPLCLLPGSRRAEITTMLPLFCKLLKQDPNLSQHGVILPTLPYFKDLVESHTQDLNIQIITDSNLKYKSIARSRLALAASGTVSLELGLLGIPMIIGYKTHPLTAFLLKHLVHSPYVSLVNILLNQPLVPELLQARCTLKNFHQAIYNEELSIKQREFLPYLKDLVTRTDGLDPAACVAQHIVNIKK